MDYNWERTSDSKHGFNVIETMTSFGVCNFDLHSINTRTPFGFSNINASFEHISKAQKI